MDAAASVITLVELSEKIIRYIKDAKGATTERQRLLNELSICKYVFGNIIDRLTSHEKNAHWSAIAKILQGRSGLLVVLEETLQKLEPKISRGHMIESLTWPFQREDVDKTIKIISRLKETLLLALASQTDVTLQKIETGTAGSMNLLEKLQFEFDQGWQEQIQFNESAGAALNRIEDTQSGIDEDVRKIAKHVEIAEHKQIRNDILSMLNNTDYCQIHDQILECDQHPGPWERLFRSQEYHDWEDATGSLLLAYGEPGVGKSVVTKSVIETLKKTMKGKAGIAYIYLKSNTQARQDCTQLISSLLRQLIIALPYVPDFLVELHEDCQRRKSGLLKSTIRETLQKVVSTYAKVYIVVDGLDEGLHKEMGNFVKEIRNLQPVNIFISSRDTPQSRKLFRKDAQIAIEPSIDEFKVFVQDHAHQIFDDVCGNSALLEEVQNKIVECAFPSYLLASLQARSLQDEASPADIRDALKNLPDKVDEAYDVFMERIRSLPEKSAALATRTLLWLAVNSEIPFTDSALGEALAARQGTREYDPERLPPFKKVASVCMGLVRQPRGSDKVELCHDTAREYLRRTKRNWFANPETYMATACLTHLAYAGIDKRCGPDVGTSQVFDIIRESSSFRNFYDYALRYWTYHVRQAQLEDQNLDSAAFSLPLNILNRSLLHVAKGGDEEGMEIILARGADVNFTNEKGQTSLHLAVLQNHLGCVKLLLPKGPESLVDDENMTPFHYAVHISDKEVATAFLEIDKTFIDLAVARFKRQLHQHATPWTKAGRGLTPLHYAVLSVNLEMLRYLLHQGANVNASSDKGETALHLCIKTSVEDSTNDEGFQWEGQSLQSVIPQKDQWTECRPEVILDCLDFDPYDPEDDEYHTTKGAIEKIRVEVFEILLGQEDIDVNAKDDHGKSPVQYLVSKKTDEHYIMLKMLCAQKPDLSTRDLLGASPIHYACAASNLLAAEILLDHGADLAAIDNNGQTTAHYGAKSCDSEILDWIFNMVEPPQATVLARTSDNFRRNALHNLFKQNDKDIRQDVKKNAVEVLLDRGVDVNHVDLEGHTPISTYVKGPWIWGPKNTDAVKLLLERGANVAFSNDHSQLNLLHLAAANFQPLSLEFLRVLEDAGVDSLALDAEERTILHHLAIGGRLESDVLDYLEHLGLERDAPDRTGKTAWDYAHQENKKFAGTDVFGSERWGYVMTMLRPTAACIPPCLET